ncbi:MAG: rhomboid family intramembrane serine protease [Bifidobacteriaceae bacterium]|jgi:membrane associated rhomboid family serine protease|nr:rhomboid family intramembrane serine protease [Bifidobacteriaceae bacterium]
MTGKRQDHTFPLITAWLIVICCVVWLIELIPNNNLITQGSMFKFAAPIQPWRYLTYMFLHATEMGNFILPINPLHIALNMYSLWILGRILEPYLGRARFLIVYLLCGLGAAFIPTGFAFIAPNALLTFTSSIGASGAIMGLFGVLILLFRRLRMPYNQLILVLALNIGIPLLIPGIDWGGHLAGAFTGIIMGIALGYTRWNIPTKFTAKKWFALFAIGLLALFIIIEVWILVNYMPDLKYASEYLAIASGIAT